MLTPEPLDQEAKKTSCCILGHTVTEASHHQNKAKLLAYSSGSWSNTFIPPWPKMFLRLSPWKPSKTSWSSEQLKSSSSHEQLEISIGHQRPAWFLNNTTWHNKLTRFYSGEYEGPKGVPLTSASWHFANPSENLKRSMDLSWKENQWASTHKHVHTQLCTILEGTFMNSLKSKYMDSKLGSLWTGKIGFYPSVQ